MKIFSDNLMPGLILALITIGITIFVGDYMDDENNQIGLLSRKTVFLLIVMTLLIALLSLLLLRFSENKIPNKLNKANRTINTEHHDQIDRKQKNLLKNLSVVANKFSSGNITLTVPASASISIVALLLIIILSG